MSTQLFISWSGDLSQQVSTCLHAWIPSVLQSVDPFVSSEDIDKGSRWSDHVASKLQECGFGIIVLTPDNLSAPWILFEAGALSKMVGTSNVAPLLIDIQIAQIRPPLSQFQITRFEEDDFFRLIKSINTSSGLCVKEDILQRTFRAMWPSLKDEIEEIVSNYKSADMMKSPNEQAPKVDLNSISLSIGDLIKSVHSMHSDLRINQNSPRETIVALGAIKDLDASIETIENEFDEDGDLIMLSGQISPIVKKLKAISSHLKRKRNDSVHITKNSTLNDIKDIED